MARVASRGSERVEINFVRIRKGGFLTAHRAYTDALIDVETADFLPAFF